MTDAELLQRARAGEVIGDGKRQIELMNAKFDDLILAISINKTYANAVTESLSILERELRALSRPKKGGDA